MIKDKCVLGEVHRAFNGVLDRYETQVHFVGGNGIEHIRNRSQWHTLKCGKIGLGDQGLLGECSGWAEIADTTCFRHAVKAMSSH